MRKCSCCWILGYHTHCLGLVILSLALAEPVAETGQEPLLHESEEIVDAVAVSGHTGGVNILPSIAESLPAFYHTSEDLRAFAAELAAPGPGHCPGLRLIRSTFPESKSTQAKPITELEGEAAWTYKNIKHEGVVDTIIISRLNTSIAKPALRYALFFGEHGRELVSAEVGMHLLKAFCGRADVDSAVRNRAQQLLSYAEVLILPNVDESGRMSAEQGAFCERDNFEQVDLNRNWDYMWSNSTDGNFPGSHPFSEPETQIARKHLEAFKPTAFLSVHSGNRALWTPGAYDIDDSAAKARKGPAVWDTLLAISSHVKDYTHCNCLVGAPGRVANTRHPGTSIDYAGLKMNVPYAMAWEIWMKSNSDCLPHFSPTAPDEFSRVLQKWSLAMVYFGEAASAAVRGLEPIDVLAPSREFSARQRFDSTLRHLNHHNGIKGRTSGPHKLALGTQDGAAKLRQSKAVANFGEPRHLRSTLVDEHRRSALSAMALFFLILVCVVTGGMMFQKHHALSLKK